jgi:hypothetical protein
MDSIGDDSAQKKRVDQHFEIKFVPKPFPHFDHHPLQKGASSLKYVSGLIVLGKPFWDKL